jgi:hypothetical protein
MKEIIYYQDPDTKITNAFVQGRAGIYPLESVVGIEAKRPTIMIALGLAFVVALAFAPVAPEGDPAWYRPAVIVFTGLYLISLLGWIFLCPVFVRTASGRVKLGVPKFPAARRAIMQAFAEAKSAAAQ